VLAFAVLPTSLEAVAASGQRAHLTAPSRPARSTPADIATSGMPRVWQDRGELNPTRVYFGAPGAGSDPLARLPAPPFSNFEPDDKDRMATSPKAKVTDSKKVHWTAKFGVEVHADTTAPRLAWALGFGSVEGYYVPSGKIEGIDAKTNLGREKGAVFPDGTFPGGSRFKRHDEAFAPEKDAKGEDRTWDESRNPGVPPEQLSGLLIFDVMTNNWDAQPKNCKVYRLKGSEGPEEWYIVSDMGAAFGGGPRQKFVLAGYQKETSFIKSVTSDIVEFKFADIVGAQTKAHQRVPLAHAQWFRKQLLKLTDDEIQAAFDAGFATDALNRAYAGGDAAAIKAAREKEIPAETRSEIAAYVAAFRARIEEFKAKVPAA
jgi:hypothetical protein